MLSEEQIRVLLETKEKEREQLEFKRMDAVEKMKYDYKLTIEIGILKSIL
jgi:hypothetical protein